MADGRPGGEPAARGSTAVPTRRAVAAAVAATAASSAPVFLLGAVAVGVRGDLDISRTQLGLAVAAAYAASVVVGPWVASRIERIGPTLGARTTASVCAVALLGLAVAVRSFWALLVVMAIAGVGQAFGHPSANGMLVRSLPPERRGMAFGIKQVGIPLPALVAGVSLPTVALTVGWRWALAGAALLFALAVPVVPRLAEPAGTDGDRRTLAARHRSRLREVRSPALTRLALAGVLAAVAVVSYGAFFVDSAVAAGVDEGMAGTLLAYGSMVSIGVRLLLGWLVDRKGLDPLRGMVGMMAVGAAGTVLLGSTSQAWLLALVVTVVWAFGWSWNPLIDLVVIRIGSAAPAAASSFAVTGFYAGAAVGPFVVGAIADRMGYQAAWAVAAACLAASALLAATVRGRSGG